MNNKTNLAIAFLLAGTLLTGTTVMTQAYAEEDHDDERYDDDKRYDKGGDGNKQKVEDDSAGAIADCDKNEVERADFDCIAAAATDESDIGTGDGDGNGDLQGDCPEGLVQVDAEPLLCLVVGPEEECPEGFETVGIDGTILCAEIEPEF
jgi:hypothetical protein